MGIFYSMFFNSQPQRLLLLGLDAAGKTTVLYKMHLGEVVTTIPTIGFNVETIQVKNVSFTIWDIGGQERIRALWRHYYQGVNGIIFVVDSSDVDRIDEAADELNNILNEDQLKGASLVVLANKQDLPTALSVNQLSEKLGLFSIKDRKWFVQSTCAVTGEGIWEGMKWLTDAVKSKQ